MSQGPLCPNLSQKVQKEVSQMANRNLSPMILLGGLSVNLNHLKRCIRLSYFYTFLPILGSKFNIPTATEIGQLFRHLTNQHLMAQQTA